MTSNKSSLHPPPSLSNHWGKRPVATSLWLLGQAMLQGQKVIQEVAWIIIRVASILSKDEIATYTGYSPATIKQILLYFKQNRTVQESDRARSRGKESCKTWILRWYSIYLSFWCRLIFCQILFGSVRKQPGYYLDELQEIMNTTCGVQVSKVTVWRTLHKAGCNSRVGAKGLLRQWVRPGRDEDHHWERGLSK